MKIRLGTRGSHLALVQTESVASRLRDSGHEVEIVRIVTEGDVRPIDSVPGEGIFVAAIANALLRGEIDAAVHSAKDLPLDEESETGRRSIGSLPSAATVGTDSPRRAGFIRAARGDLRIAPLHGNVDTRLRRLDAGEVDALVIAAAGLERLGRADRVDQRIDPEVVPPAPAQGALAVQARDGEVFKLLVGGVNSDGSDLQVEWFTGRRSDAMAIAEAAGRRLAAAVGLR